ncbi:uncharacterized protein LOC118451304 isoform X2 [Vespa mandarinia]|uniref:uncharacterized protein LOC118451304 isoform X2 n=1 Tax=Vespa mandarinia TaxID=7446 RepID=UPI0016135E37|nr:uncharacterized protein LOC118451304 isoform X2 [Vespa mandarinia]
MIKSKQSDCDYMSLIIIEKYPDQKLVEVLESEASSKSNKIDCKKMAAVPQAAFAASKVRHNEKHDNSMISVIEGKEKASKENTYNGRFYLEGWELTPLKYNSKLMNSIWGLYNRYSVHNFKKNTDADEGFLATVWQTVYSNPSSVMSASVVSASTTMETPRILGTRNGI